MRVLTATRELQGTAPGDYCWAVEGELVLADVAECDRPDQCGCGRGFPGVASRHATTTAMVTDLPHLDRNDLDAVIGDLVEQQWADLLAAQIDDDDPDPDATVAEHLAAITAECVENIEQVCRSFPVGTVVQRHGTRVSERAVPHAA